MAATEEMNEPPGVVKNDSKARFKTAFIIPVTPAQHGKALQKIQQVQTNPGNYDLHDNNCADFCLEVLKDAGVPVHYDNQGYQIPQIGNWGLNDPSKPDVAPLPLARSLFQQNVPMVK